MLDALYSVIDASGVSLQDCLIFLPSRRAVRSAEKMFVQKKGGAVILPKLVALGEGVDSDEIISPDVFSNQERVILLAKLLSADANIGNISTALSVARDLVRCQDYLENEGVDSSKIDWESLVDDKYAEHFQAKAKMLDILTRVLPAAANGRMTSTAQRNADVRAWKGEIDKYPLVIVCGSTASVPATADLMVAVANAKHGRIILPGKIDGRVIDFELDTNPYNAEYKFLKRVNVEPNDVIKIDVGNSNIDFMNYAFGNNTNVYDGNKDLQNCHLINAETESIEAAAVAEICARAVANNKSVMVITPDAAGNQRIKSALADLGLDADFSGAESGATIPAARAILNLLDSWAESNGGTWDSVYTRAEFNLFDTIANIISDYIDYMSPEFEIDADDSGLVWTAIKNLSDYLAKYDIKLSLSDARAFIADSVATISVRDKRTIDSKIVVLGTIESRMQTADVVILTGLNDGMFPARGYENAWLPASVAEQIGLPSPNRKVSLMSLDFMNLSCGADVYWLRSANSGGVKTAESRFISRVMARGGMFDKDSEKSILESVHARDDVQKNPLDYSAPNPPSDWSDVYVTELEKLIHNPYAFYVAHILRLKPRDDWWVGPDARVFGNLVHDVIEHARDFSPTVTIAEMDRAAREVLHVTNTENMLFKFWHKRFVDIAGLVAQNSELLSKSVPEIGGHVKIENRVIRARADRVWDGGVLDIKTGAAPNKSQLMDGNMPQLPLEAYMLQHGGFNIKTTDKSKIPEMVFMQLKNFDAKMIWYDADDVREMMNAAIAKVVDLVRMYSVGNAPYEYHETGDAKYKSYDDLARVDD